jgi:hypothetical protein
MSYEVFLIKWDVADWIEDSCYCILLTNTTCLIIIIVLTTIEEDSTESSNPFVIRSA